MVCEHKQAASGNDLHCGGPELLSRATNLSPVLFNFVEMEMAKIFQISPGLMSQLVYYPVIPVSYLTCYTKLSLEKDPRIYKAILAMIFFLVPFNIIHNSRSQLN